MTKQLPALTAPVRALFESGEVSSKTGKSVRCTGVPAHIYWMIPSWKDQKCLFSIWDPSLPPLLLLIVQNQVVFSPTLVHKRKSINPRKHRQMPTCSQGLPHWLYSRAFAVDGFGDKHGPADNSTQQSAVLTLPNIQQGSAKWGHSHPREESEGQRKDKLPASTGS